MPLTAVDTVKCIDCAHFRLKGAGQMAALGFGLCDKGPSKSSFMSSVYPHQCEMWSEADEHVREARRSWMDKRREAGR